AGAEIDALEHERPQLLHRGAGLRALEDLARVGGALDEIVHERVNARRAAVAEHRERLERKLVLAQQTGPYRVLDVVVDICHAVHQAHDPPLERARQLGAPGMPSDTVAHLLGQVEPRAIALEMLDDPQRVLVVAKARAERLAQAAIENLLADVPE